jgi:hypothetical protein
MLRIRVQEISWTWRFSSTLTLVRARNLYVFTAENFPEPLSRYSSHTKFHSNAKYPIA